MIVKASSLPMSGDGRGGTNVEVSYCNASGGCIEMSPTHCLDAGRLSEHVTYQFDPRRLIQVAKMVQ